MESFRRRHPGQGTANLCFCFDNAYLELLWIEDAAEAASCALARCGLAARADWRNSGASPFGIALSSDDPAAAFPLPAWDYAAPFLPAGQSIPVALASDDPRQPLLFRSPGAAGPESWTDGRAGARQRAAGFAAVAGLELAFPRDVTPAPELEILAGPGLVRLAAGAAPGLTLTLSRSDGGRPCRLRLPEMVLD